MDHTSSNNSESSSRLFPKKDDPPVGKRILKRVSNGTKFNVIKKKKRSFNYFNVKEQVESLFDIEEGRMHFNVLLKCEKDELIKYWESLKLNDRVSLVKYVCTANYKLMNQEGEKAFRETIDKIKNKNHFPGVIAKVFFEIVFNKGYLKCINHRFKSLGWKKLTKDEKIIILYDLSCLYPELIKNQEKIYDVMLDDPGFLHPIVVKEINRLAIMSGDFKKSYEKFKLGGWRKLPMDEKIVLTNGLCKKHRGITEDLNQVLYNLRVYKEIPDVVIAEKNNNAIDVYLQEGKTSQLITTINNYYLQSKGELIPMKGVGEKKIQETVNKYKSTFLVVK